MKLCKQDTCTTKIKARGLCSTHYSRWRLHGDPAAMMKSPNGSPFSSRMDRFVDRSGECWLWTGATQKDGYGHLRIAGTLVRAHRASYEEFVGPIPEGMELDHLCSVRNCVNPEHLEPVSGTENHRRRRSSETAVGRG